jgi:hypothetical protein
MRFFQRLETVDSKFTFLDSEDNQPIDVLNASYHIVHYDGPIEIIDVDQTPLNKVVGRTGEYVSNWDVPNTAQENETYFVVATGEHPIDHTITTLEDFFRVLPRNFFSGGGGGGGGLVIKFTKP